MPKIASPERTNAQKHKVLEKAAELFALNGFHATTVEHIAKSLNLTKAAIYYYIPSKQDILYQLHDWIIQLLIDRATAVVETKDPPDVKLRNVIISHIDTAVAEMSGVAALLQMQFALTGRARAKIIRKRDKYDKMLRRLLQDGIDQGIFVPCDPVITSFYILGFINYVPHWYKANGRLSKEDIGRLFADQTLRGLLVNRPEGVAPGLPAAPEMPGGLVAAAAQPVSGDLPLVSVPRRPARSGRRLAKDQVGNGRGPE